MAKALLALALWLSISFSTLAAAPSKKPPTWVELTQEQQQILAPLSADWDKFNAARKRKWLGIAKRYPQMSSDEQAKVQRRMQPWAELTPEQRRIARENFRRLETLPPEKRQTLAQKWEEYMQLPEEQRKQLQAAGTAPKEPRKPAAAKRGDGASPAGTAAK